MLLSKIFAEVNIEKVMFIEDNKKSSQIVNDKGLKSSNQCVEQVYSKANILIEVFQT